jgi:hypothetical protein
MAASTVRAIMTGIETRLETINSPRMRAKATSSAAVDVPSGGGYAIVGVPETIDYHRTMGNGRIQMPVRVLVLTSAADERTGQLLLADFANPAGDASVLAAIEGGKTLGGEVEDCIVQSFRSLGLVTVGDGKYIGGEFLLAVIARGA